MIKNLNSIQAFRQKIAALDNEEVVVACEILVAMHPQDYFNALNKHYSELLQFKDAIGSVYAKRQEDYQRLIGDIAPVDLVDVSDNDTNVNTDANLTNDAISVVADEDDALDNTDITSGSEVSVPSFLLNNK